MQTLQHPNGISKHPCTTDGYIRASDPCGSNHHYFSMAEPYYQALPTNLQPLHYDVAIHNISRDTYLGNVVLDLNVHRNTTQLHLHQRDLTIGAVSAAVGCEEVEAKVGGYNKKAESFFIDFGRKLVAGETVQVKVAFEGRIQTNMAGFYRSEYVEGGETKHMLSTQFEATDARRTFPCMDEPALKATFAVHITVDAALTVLGNMPEESTEQNGDLKTVTFERTPKMSTYLLAWAVGEFEYVESFTQDIYADGKRLPVRIYTTPGYTKDAQLALDVAPRIIDYFSRIFQLQYPLPKLDLLAVHAFSHNAMENWGLITYRSTALLYSEETLDPSYKQNVAYVVAHELAHQWFGNLVTMQWWDELWLNEGFATWVGYAAVDHLFPEWDIFSGFVSTSLQTALQLDGLRNSHPIKVPVVDALDIDQLFDAISYLKGASTIRMLSHHLSQDVFLRGVARYLNTHQFGNATSADLWNAIGEVSGRPVAVMMEEWISRIGFPVLSVVQEGSDMVVRQLRFLNGGGVLPHEDETVWWVPLDAQGTHAVPRELHIREVDVCGVPNGFFKLNGDTAGAFRVNYAPSILNANILPYFGTLSIKDKVGVVADVAAIAVSGDEQTSTTTFLDLVRLVVDNHHLGDSYVVWLELSTKLEHFQTTFSGIDAELSAMVASFTKHVYQELAVRMVTEKVDALDFLKRKLRAHILRVAATAGIPEVDAYAAELFATWKKTKQMDPALRLFVFSNVVSAPAVSEADFEAILSEVTHPTSLDSREIVLGALGHIQEPVLAARLVNYLTDESVVPVMDAHFLGVSLSKNVAVRDHFWQFFKANYARLHQLMSTNMVVLDRFIKVTLKNFQSEEMKQEVEAHFAGKDTHGFERALSQVLDQIEINGAWYTRDHAAVKQWMSENGF